MDAMDSQIAGSGKSGVDKIPSLSESAEIPLWREKNLSGKETLAKRDPPVWHVSCANSHSVSSEAPMKVSEIMTAEVKCCHAKDSLNTAAQLMWDFDCGCIPVVDDSGRPIAMLTDRDVCMAAYTQGAKLTDRPVASAMSKEIYTCRTDDELALVEEMMRQCRVRRLPVIDAQGRLAGIISLNDIAEAAERECATNRDSRRIPDFEIARVLSAVCKHREAVLADGNSHGWTA